MSPQTSLNLAATDVRKMQRRTMSLLLTSQTLGSIAVTVTFAVSGILAAEMSGSTSAAGMIQASLTVGAGAASYLMATWMNRRGRRAGLAIGYLIGAFGAATCVVAADINTFPLLVVGAVALGAASASTNAARYAATDLAPAAHRASALARVVWVATAGAVLGPLLLGPAEDVATDVGLPPLAGPFLFNMACAAIAGLVIFAFLRPDPLLLARKTRVVEHETKSPTTNLASSLATVAPTIAALVMAHATMVAVMVMTPIEMHHGGAAHSAIGAVISAHFLGMYAFSPLAGLLADRAGTRPALVIGSAILMLSLVVQMGAIGATAFTHGLGLFLLGLGWSVCTVAASSHIAEQSAGDTRVQGAADTAMTVMSAGAAAAAGPLMALWGFNGLITLAAVLSIGVLIAAQRIRSRHGVEQRSDVVAPEPTP